MTFEGGRMKVCAARSPRQQRDLATLCHNFVLIVMTEGELPQFCQFVLKTPSRYCRNWLTAVRFSKDSRRLISVSGIQGTALFTV
jgi:hypothetical protein